MDKILYPLLPQNGDQRNLSKNTQILTIRRNIEATLFFVDFSQAFDSTNRGNLKQIRL